MLNEIQELLDLKSEIQKIQQKIYSLENEKSLKATELLNKTLNTESVINQMTWDFQGDQILYSKDTKHKLLTQLLQTDYHCHFENDDLSLNFSDWDIYLCFKSQEKMFEFVHRNKLKINSSEVKKQIEQHKQTIISCQKSIEQLENEQKKIESLNSHG